MLTVSETGSKADFSPENLLISFKGNVSAHHVVQQDSQRPYGCRLAIILSITDPLWWSVHSGS